MQHNPCRADASVRLSVCLSVCPSVRDHSLWIDCSFSNIKDGRRLLVFFRICKFYYMTWSTGSTRISVPNFVKIGQSVAKVLRSFNFSRWQPSAILNLFGAQLDHAHRVLRGLYHPAKFDYNRCSSFDNMNVSIFGVFGWNTPIHTPKNLWFYGYLTP